MARAGVRALLKKNPGFSSYRDDMEGAAALAILETLEKGRTDSGYLYRAGQLAALSEANGLRGVTQTVAAGKKRTPRDIISLSDDRLPDEDGLTEDDLLRRVDAERALEKLRAEKWERAQNRPRKKDAER